MNLPNAPAPGEELDTGIDQEISHVPQYHVILLNDDDHTYEYVIYMLGSIFGYSREKAFLMAVEVDTAGRVIVYTAPLEKAEHKRDLIHGFGADSLLPHSKGSMSAVLESVP